ncbi:MAG: GLPGLI family protein [Prevotellaceae bacterium]|jgi:GLPGLI family protein|nr:GLPGLI family protein [Prevotellaceae bacterium]
MKKIIIITVTFICALSEINAQQHIDNMQLKCLYEHYYQYSTSKSTQMLIDTMRLEVGQKICKFYSCNYGLFDSTVIVTGDVMRIVYKSKPNKSRNSYTVYVNYPENKTTFNGNAIGTLNYFEYIEDFEIPRWTVHSETQTILSHLCKKATCRFRGRDYVAWYALDIPISRGPYKFAGLPGLILKIADTENLYSFECIGIEKANTPMYKEKKDGIETVPTTREKFIHMEKRTHQNPKSIVEIMTKNLGFNFDDIKDKIPDNAKVNYNPIELE